MSEKEGKKRENTIRRTPEEREVFQESCDDEQ